MYRDKIDYFDHHADAPWSAAEYGQQEQRKLQRLFDHTGSLEGCSVLEPGCGTGRLTTILADRVGVNGRVIALDISARMVAAARTRNRDRTQVSIHLTAVEEFSFGEQRFDLIICHQVFPHFENPETVLGILAKTLNPKGRLIIMHFINFAEINDCHRKAGTAVAADSMPEPEAMQALIERSGLTVECLLDDRLGYFLCARPL